MLNNVDLSEVNQLKIDYHIVNDYDLSVSPLPTILLTLILNNNEQSESYDLKLTKCLFCLWFYIE